MSGSLEKPMMKPRTGVARRKPLADTVRQMRKNLLKYLASKPHLWKDIVDMLIDGVMNEEQDADGNIITGRVAMRDRIACAKLLMEYGVGLPQSDPDQHMNTNGDQTWKFEFKRSSNGGGPGAVQINVVNDPSLLNGRSSPDAGTTNVNGRPEKEIIVPELEYIDGEA